jgi:hypothetical protein
MMLICSIFVYPYYLNPLRPKGADFFMYLDSSHYRSNISRTIAELIFRPISIRLSLYCLIVVPNRDRSNGLNKIHHRLLQTAVCLTGHEDSQRYF